MKPERYADLRRSVGSQTAVAKKLDITQSTITRRENGRLPIGREAAYAMRYLASRVPADA